MVCRSRSSSDSVCRTPLSGEMLADAEKAGEVMKQRIAEVRSKVVSGKAAAARNDGASITRRSPKT